MCVKVVDSKGPTKTEECMRRYQLTNDINDYIDAWIYSFLEDDGFLTNCCYEFAYRDFEGLEDLFESEYDESE